MSRNAIYAHQVVQLRTLTAPPRRRGRFAFASGHPHVAIPTWPSPRGHPHVGSPRGLTTWPHHVTSPRGHGTRVLARPHHVASPRDLPTGPWHTCSRPAQRGFERRVGLTRLLSASRRESSVVIDCSESKSMKRISPTSNEIRPCGRARCIGPHFQAPGEAKGEVKDEGSRGRGTAGARRREDADEHPGCLTLRSAVSSVMLRFFDTLSAF